MEAKITITEIDHAPFLIAEENFSVERKAEYAWLGKIVGIIEVNFNPGSLHEKIFHLSGSRYIHKREIHNSISWWTNPYGSERWNHWTLGNAISTIIEEE